MPFLQGTSVRNFRMSTVLIFKENKEVACTVLLRTWFVYSLPHLTPYHTHGHQSFGTDAI